MRLPTGDPDSTLLSIPDLQLILTAHVRRLGLCVWPIWERYLTIPEADRLDFDLTTEATVLNRFMVGYAKREFTGVPGVQFSEEDGFVLLIDGFPYGLSGQAAIRLKKLDSNGKSRNNLGTSRARALRSNDNDLLEGIPPEATWVDVGHVLNGLRTGIGEVQAIRVKDSKFIMSIPREEGGVIGLTYPLPLDGPRGGEGGSESRFTVVPRKEQQGKPDSETSTDE